MLWMEPVPVPRDGGERNVNSLARMVPTAWTVPSAVTAATLTGATPPRATAAASRDGQVFTVTVSVLRDSGVQIAPCLVTAKMEHPALQMMGSVSVHQDTEAPLARESARRGFTDTAAARPARSACTAVAPATTSLACVTACLDSQEPSAMKCVPVADLGRTALEYAPAPIMGLAILLIDPASATLDGLVVTALSLAHLPTGDQTASTRATATMELSAVPTMGSASAPRAGLAFTAHRGVPWGFSGRTVP